MPVAAQLVVTAGVALTTMTVAVRSFLPAGPAAQEISPPIRAAWRERRTVAIGVLVLCYALVEGVANDWLTIALVDGHGASEAVGALAVGLFVTAMTAVRLVGGPLLARHGRPAVPVLWGAGAALGFPVGMSAAADEPARAPASRPPVPAAR